MPDDDIGDILSQVDALLDSAGSGSQSSASPSAVQPFNRARLEAHLKSEGHRYLKDQDDDFVIQLPSGELGGQVVALLMPEGQKEQLLAIRIWSDRRYPREQAGKLLLACNTWNVQKRWPKACMRFDAAETEARITLEFDIDLGPGVHAALLEDLILTAVSTGYSFWKWALEEQGL